MKLSSFSELGFLLLKRERERDETFKKEKNQEKDENEDTEKELQTGKRVKFHHFRLSVCVSWYCKKI